MDKKELSNKEKLENYLLLDEKKIPFLLDDNNNGKTIMLSGAWGAGKTHFWREEIEPELSKELKNKEKACVYVSLYGKDSLDTLKKEIYIKASSEKELLSKEVSTFGFDALSSIKDSDLKLGQAAKAIGGLYNKHKSDKGIKRLKDGGLICLDDFERKSKKIDLNDLFGFISQLAIEMNCKVVIILNDDVFTGKEAEVFRNVKEKTVNKFFYFEPTPEELFESIAKDIKYDDLEDYKADILKAIKETEELNARIYIQVLDNCLECLNVKETLDKDLIRVLVLGTFNFVLNHMVFKYIHIDKNIEYSILEIPTKISQSKYIGDVTTIWNRYDDISDLTKSILSSDKSSVMEKEFLINFIHENKKKLEIIWKYGYNLHYVTEIDRDIYNEIAEFIKSGILI